jgi:hypothetical protein
MADIEANFLNLANDGAGISEEKEKPKSLFQDPEKMKQIFDIEQKSSKNKKPNQKEAPPQLSKADEEERVSLIRRYNDYMRDQIISRRLQKAGYPIKTVSYDISLSVIRGMWKDVEDCLSGDESKMLAFQGISMLNKAAMRYQPILAESPSLQDVFINNLQDADSNMSLSMAELSIRIQPYTPAGFFARFAAAYGMMIKTTADMRDQQKSQEMDKKFKEEDLKEMEDKYSGL